jgi:5-amino-6-(5-phosphoribosylamino)uracil reductase/diaminohydroxyphosphoribosylaminopyrimidine deaminase/5-amino-6-(5-phosphoribosylamino)uracil reductase
LNEFPILTISYAQTLDGRMATLDRISQWISGDESLVYAHGLRARNDGIMVGIGTVLADNPRLTVRLVPGDDPQRIVVDSQLRIPADAAVLAAGAASGTLIATTSHAPAERRYELEALGATILEVPADAAGQVDLVALLPELRRRGLRSIMVEGGPTLITALFQARLAGRVAITVAPKLMGAGIAPIGDLGIRRLEALLQLENVILRHYGPDLIVEADVRYPE